MIQYFAIATLSICLITGDRSAIEVSTTSGKALDVEVLGYTKSSGNLRIMRISDGKIFNTIIELFEVAARYRFFWSWSDSMDFTEVPRRESLCFE